MPRRRSLLERPPCLASRLAHRRAVRWRQPPAWPDRPPHPRTTVGVRQQRQRHRALRAHLGAFRRAPVRQLSHVRGRRRIPQSSPAGAHAGAESGAGRPPVLPPPGSLQAGRPCIHPLTPALSARLPCPQNKVLLHMANISGATDARFTYFGAALGGEPRQRAQLGTTRTRDLGLRPWLETGLSLLSGLPGRPPARLAALCVRLAACCWQVLQSVPRQASADAPPLHPEGVVTRPPTPLPQPMTSTRTTRPAWW